MARVRGFSGKKMKYLPILFALVFHLGTVYAKDLGVHGRVYEIAEENMLKVLMKRAQAQVDSGEWDKRVEQWRKKAKQQVARPHGIVLPRAKKTTSHLFDPSIIVPKDIKDAAGQLIRAKGTRINPLTYVSMSQTLVFIDGDDTKQIDWIKKSTAQQPDKYRIILTNGPVIDLSKQLKRKLFFDQRQYYIKKLAIKSLPAIVYQQGMYLRIDEVAMP